MDRNVSIEEAANGFTVRTWGGGAGSQNFIASTLEEAFTLSKTFFDTLNTIRVPKGTTTVEMEL